MSPMNIGPAPRAFQGPHTKRRKLDISLSWRPAAIKTDSLSTGKLFLLPRTFCFQIGQFCVELHMPGHWGHPSDLWACSWILVPFNWRQITRTDFHVCTHRTCGSSKCFNAEWLRFRATLSTLWEDDLGARPACTESVLLTAYLPVYWCLPCCKGLNILFYATQEV